MMFEITDVLTVPAREKHISFWHGRPCLAVSTVDNRCRIYDYGHPGQISLAHEIATVSKPTSITISPSDRFIALGYISIFKDGSFVGGVHVWDTQVWSEDKNASSPETCAHGWQGFQCVGFTSKEDWMVAASGDRVAIYGFQEQQFLFTTDPTVVRGDEEPWIWLLGCNGVAVHPDDTFLVTAHGGESFGLWEKFDIAPDRRSLIWREDQEIEADGYLANPATFSADGNWFVVSDTAVKLYDVLDHKLIHQLPLPSFDSRCSTNSSSRGLAWSPAVFTPDSRSIVAVSPFGLLCRWNVGDGLLIDTLQLPYRAEGRRKLAISQFDATLAVADPGDTVSFLQLQ